MLFDPKKLLLIAGPCSLENEQVCRSVAEVLTKLAKKHRELNIIFKGSFDKANRTSLGGRGTGLKEGLRLLALIKKDYGFPVLTDIHERQQCAPVARVCDVLQIPAFLCRQTDLLLAASWARQLEAERPELFEDGLRSRYDDLRLAAEWARRLEVLRPELVC